jgi:DNA-binding NtrC family response regulator
LRILLADDEKGIRLTLGDDLRDAGHDVTVVDDGLDAWKLVEDQEFGCLVTDIRMPGKNGIELLQHVKSQSDDTAVIVITGYGTIESAVQAMKIGAYDYILKPFPNEKIVALVEKIENYNKLKEENVRLRSELRERYSFDKIVGKSKKMREVYDIIETLRDNDSNILIEGETGTGKELIALAIHHNSRRKGKAFVPFNVGQFPETLIEDELFGHEKGAFTDARERKIGRFERAGGGTVFLDDIDDMVLPTQVKLLRILQERKFERLGGTQTIEIDIRIVSATKVNLEDLVAEGRFREDLYYRLNVVKISLPPLRERHEDIILLANHFVKMFGGDREFVIPPEALEAMTNYPWPGNVRELENAIERAVALSGKSKKLRTEHIVRPSVSENKIVTRLLDLRPLKEVVNDAEKLHIKNVLRHTQGQKAKAATLLGISRKNLWEKMKDYELE